LSFDKLDKLYEIRLINELSNIKALIADLCTNTEIISEKGKALIDLHIENIMGLDNDNDKIQEIFRILKNKFGDMPNIRLWQ